MIEQIWLYATMKLARIAEKKAKERFTTKHTKDTKFGKN